MELECSTGQTPNVGEHVNMDTAASPVEGTTDSDHSPVLVQTVYKEQL